MKQKQEEKLRQTIKYGYKDYKQKGESRKV